MRVRCACTIPGTARYHVFATRRARFCPRFLPGVYVSAGRRFKVRWCGYLNVIISPDGCRVYGRRRDASKRRRRLKFHPEIGAMPNIRISVRRRSLRHRYRSVEAAFALLSDLWISQGFLDISFACLSLFPQEGSERSQDLCHREPVLYSVNYLRRYSVPYSVITPTERR